MPNDKFTLFASPSAGRGLLASTINYLVKESGKESAASRKQKIKKQWDSYFRHTAAFTAFLASVLSTWNIRKTPETEPPTTSWMTLICANLTLAMYAAKEFLLEPLIDCYYTSNYYYRTRVKAISLAGLKNLIQSLNDSLNSNERLTPQEVDLLTNKVHRGLSASTTLCEASLSQELQDIINTELDNIIDMQTAPSPSESDSLLSQLPNNYDGENSSDNEETELSDRRSLSSNVNGRSR